MPKDGKTNSIATGAAIETVALDYLTARGLKALEKNYRCRAGEIDLVMADGQTVVFVEVRYRRHNYFGGGAASVTTGKQRKLLRAAQHYMQQQNINAACRFDVIDVCSASKNHQLENRAAPQCVETRLNQVAQHRQAARGAVNHAGESYLINWIDNAFIAPD